MTEKKSTTSSMDVFDVTFIVFLINKLAGVAPMADWSWWLVLRLIGNPLDRQDPIMV